MPNLVDGELVQKCLSLCVVDPERVTPVEREVKSVAQAYQALGAELAGGSEAEGKTAQFYAYEAALRDYAYGGVAIVHATQHRNDEAVKAAEGAERQKVRLRANKAADKLVEAAKSTVAEALKVERQKRKKVTIDEADEARKKGVTDEQPTPEAPVEPPAGSDAGGVETPGGDSGGTAEAPVTPVEPPVESGPERRARERAERDAARKAEEAAAVEPVAEVPVETPVVEPAPVETPAEPVVETPVVEAPVEPPAPEPAPVEAAPEPPAEVPVEPVAETPATPDAATVDAALEAAMAEE